MPKSEHLIEQTSQICLLNFHLGQLRSVLDNKELAKALTEYDESSALARIDELINLYEAPVTGLLLNDKTVMEVKDEWMVTLPVSLAESIKKFLENYD